MARRLIAALGMAFLPACASIDPDSSARAWQAAECNRINDQADRERCLERVDRTYGRR